MATDVNKVGRKRKSTSDLIFEVSEADCSPCNTPEPTEGSISCSISENEGSQTSTDVSKVVITTEEVVKLKSEEVDVDYRCMDMDVDNSPPPPPDMNKPLISLIFRDKEVADRLKFQIVSFIKGIVDFELDEVPEPDSDKIHLWDNLNDFVDGEKKCEPLNPDLFVVDTTPSKKLETLPRYLPNHCDVIEETDKEESARTKTPMKFRPITICFNCDGNHSMKECKEIKNYRRISIARSKFMAGNQSKAVRYHLDEEQKYEHLTPGKISEKLRRALDIRKYEIPPYVYRMRMLGYPPGWLQEAMISNTKLEIFDFEGCTVENGNGDNPVIDPGKVIEYPGFNAPFEKGFKDEHKYYQCPPYSELHSKKYMLEYIEKMAREMESNKPNKENFTRQNVSTAEEFDSNSQESECAEKGARSSSPSLTDLELRKKQLLAELEEGNLNSPQPEASLNPASTSEELLPAPPAVMSSSFGTPIIKSASPFVQLPDRDKFSKDISQVINFENLPNSTGKYEQISKVINKVRDVVRTGNFAQRKTS